MFTSEPRRHVVVFKNRKGLCRLSLETGAELVPTYVFGATDFFCTGATSDHALARLSRKLRIGMTLFWGQWFCPLIPFTPKVTMCIGEPLPVERWTGPRGKIPDELVDVLHEKYLASIVEMFEKYKTAAGYPDAKLEMR